MIKYNGEESGCERCAAFMFTAGATLFTEQYYCFGLFFVGGIYPPVPRRKSSEEKEQAWSWVWTRAIMNIYLILQKSKAPGYSTALVILTWNECIMSYSSCSMPKVTCSAEQMTARFSLASAEARTAILGFNIAADIAWTKKSCFVFPLAPAEDRHHTNWWGE